MSKILLVEDGPIEQRMYQRILTQEGFEVIVVNNGSECRAKAIEVNPDIILLDVMMPKMNGFDALDVLQFDPLTKNIPVVMLTNLSGSEYKDEAIRRGASKFMIKSQTENKELVRTVNDILSAYNTKPQ